MAGKTILLDGFSKAYSMTGWRIGYGVLPKWMVDAVCLLQVNSASHTASFTQRAAIEALRGPQDSVRTMVDEFRRRRDVIVDGLNSVPGFRCAKPGGAFYAFPNVEATGCDSNDLADRILQDSGVACLAGNSFGAYGARVSALQLRNRSRPYPACNRENAGFALLTSDHFVRGNRRA